MAGEDRTPMAEKKSSTGWLNLLIDYGPLLVFFGVYWFYAPADKEDGIGTVFAVVHSTGAFIVAAVIALAVSKWLMGKISRMLALSTTLIVGFGGLTILLRDPFYVQVKPTALYLFFGIVLLAGWMRGKALLQWLLEAAFEGLNDEGWLKLSRNWGVFFLFLAALNETLRHFLSFGDWLTAKLWVFMPLSFLFTFTQLPMLLRHGLATGQEEEVIENPPVE
ncbi:inner membrane-spanning protein YciB [Croceibacterium aestuarii]|uniref:inner membrane-spanning protein YciB n=1 Tax=Croceibacterium aestuarii TaxID=3064139 RepID=UPI00272E46F9|nr:inner membrane-spanning protein YciB [Croceibacterium sp. D39]